MSTLAALCWPGERLGDALAALGRAARLGGPDAPEAPLDAAAVGAAGGDALEQWLEAASAQLGFETEAVSAHYHEIGAMLRSAGTALVRLEGEDGVRFACVVGTRGDALDLAGPTHRGRVPVAELARALAAPIERRLAPELDRLLEAAEVAPSRRPRSREALLRTRTRAPVEGVWLVRPRLGEPWWRQASRETLGRALAALALLHLGVYVLLVAAWRLMGASALAGRLGWGELAAWALLLLTTVPLSAGAVWLQGRLAIGLGALLKRRLLYGVLRLDPDEIRHLGAGRLLGKVIESEAVEALSLSGGALVVLGLVELGLAGWVLGVGAGGLGHALLLGGWVGLVGALGWRYYRERRRWSAERVLLTGDLVERLTGHRTRQAQMPRPRWHEGEDEGLERYLDASERMDARALRLQALAPRGWLLVSLAALTPALADRGTDPAALGAALGGILLAHQALAKIVTSAVHLAGAFIAGEQIAMLFRAAARAEEPGRALVATRAEDAPERPLVEVSDLAYRYPGRARPVLDGVRLEVRRAERLLLEGPSGGGKSTLAALLLGLRRPDGGLVLVDGYDRPTLGSIGWRARVAAAPQFHDNHVLTGTLAFNLLMGRRWPPRPSDLDLAEEVCRELGLGPLIARMPAGMLQTVGDTGWQLSHGEKSRMFIARALLQAPELLVLDESFAALDPEALARAMACVLARARTVLVIAHP
jgi:ATP-binding cassette subfamily B protein